MASKESIRLFEKFLKQHPLQMTSPLTAVTAKDLDAFWKAEYKHGLTLEQLNNEDTCARMRNRLVSTVNNVGVSALITQSGRGCSLLLTSRSPSIWTLMPADMAASHMSRVLPDRNKKTIGNRMLAMIEKTNASNKAVQSKGERRALRAKKELIYRNADVSKQIEDQSAAAVLKIESNLKKKEPGSRLLEDNTY